MEFARWLECASERLIERWSGEIRSRGDARDERVCALMEEFFALIVRMMPGGLGPYREQVDPLWLQVSELYGSFAAARGLAAGEVIEEFQVLREALIRVLYSDPPVEGPLPLRDVLRINRVIDRGVTQASVGHTDALFFSLFQGSGVPDSVDDELVAEVQEQLETLRAEHARIMRALRT